MVVIGAEPFTDATRDEIEERLGVTTIDIYGLSELIGPGVAASFAVAAGGIVPALVGTLVILEGSGGRSPRSTGSGPRSRS